METLYSEDGKALPEAAHGCSGCPIPGGIQGHIRCGTGQTDLVGGNYVYESV